MGEGHWSYDSALFDSAHGRRICVGELTCGLDVSAWFTQALSSGVILRSRVGLPRVFPSAGHSPLWRERAWETRLVGQLPGLFTSKYLWRQVSSGRYRLLMLDRCLFLRIGISGCSLAMIGLLASCGDDQPGPVDATRADATRAGAVQIEDNEPMGQGKVLQPMGFTTSGLALRQA